MFATIMKSMTPMGIRSVAIVPINGSVRVFSRIGEGRGVSGAWHEGDVRNDIAGSELMVGEPIAIPITPADYSVLQYPVTPTVLLQKLGRTVKGNYQTVEKVAAEIYSDIYNKAGTNPTSLAVFTKALQQTTQAPQPVVVPVATIPLPQPMPEVIDLVPDEPIAMPEPEPVATAVVEPVEPPQQVAPPQPTIESEPVMTLATPQAPEAVNTVLTIPDVEEYFERTWNGLTEQEVYDFARSNQLAVLATGEAGTGKTSSVRNYAAKKKLPFVTIECTQQIDTSITQGRFVPTGLGNGVRWTYSQLATAIQQPSVILINELTRMTPKAAVLFLGLLQERKLHVDALNKVIDVHPDCLIVADQNTGFGYTGTSKMDNALLDRFNIKLEFTYDSKIESKFIHSPALLEFANAIRTASELNDEFSVPMSTRLLKNFQAQARGLNLSFAVDTLLNAFPKTDGEREAIKMRFDAEHTKIAEELGVDVGNYSA